MAHSTEFITVAEAAALLRSSVPALYTQRCHGRPPGALCVRVGRRLLYRRDVLLDWYERRLAEATSGAGP